MLSTLENTNPSSIKQAPAKTQPVSHESLALQMLVAIAERREGLDAARCRLVLTHLETAALLHGSLRQVLARHHLSDGQFAALVVLFSTEPEPISPAVLAEHTSVSRASMTETVDKLETLRLAVRTRDNLDRRVTYVRITPEGQETVDATINDYLHAAADAVRHVRPKTQRTLIAAYLQLLRGLTNPGEPLSDETPAS
jgi:DNA-binding MarR family transcriptional regulator